MTAKEYLRQAKHLDTKINTKLEHISSLHDLATKATSTLSDMPGSPTRNTHRMEDIIIKILMLENEINSDIDQLVDLKNNILKAVSEIEDEDCRLVIEKRYLNNEPWDEIAMDMNCSIDNVFKIHGRALKKFKIPERLQ